MGTTAVSAVSRGASGAAPPRRWPLAVIGATETTIKVGKEVVKAYEKKLEVQ